MVAQERKAWYVGCCMCLRTVRVENAIRCSYAYGDEVMPLEGVVCAECWKNMPPVVRTWSRDGRRVEWQLVARAY